MACKDCTYYVDGHSKNGTKLPAGQGLCTMHNKDVSASGNCNSYMTVNIKANKQTYSADKPTYNYTNVSTTPRRGMKVWATVCFVLAAIYALMGVAMDSIMFGMTAFCSILGVMFSVLKKSPKHTPHILGKQKGITKNTFVIICVAAAFCSFVLIGGTSGGMGTTPNDGTGNSSVSSKKREVTSIANFKTTEYEMLVGESLDFTLELRPKDLTEDNVGVEVSNVNILSISDMKFTTEGRKTILTFKCTATGEGEATLVIKSNTGDKTSNMLSFNVSTPPLVTAIGKFSPSYAIQEVGDKRTATCYMKPLGLTQDDFVIANSDDSIISVTNIALGSEDDKTVLTFDIIGVGVGKATIKIKGADGKTESNELQLTINEKDTSPTVYVTPYGDKYHFSSACAGNNATATTQNKAIRTGKDRCKKCG